MENITILHSKVGKDTIILVLAGRRLNRGPSDNSARL